MAPDTADVEILFSALGLGLGVDTRPNPAFGVLSRNAQCAGKREQHKIGQCFEHDCNGTHDPHLENWKSDEGKSQIRNSKLEIGLGAACIRKVRSEISNFEFEI